MPESFPNILRDWQAFYAVMGESSATLTGLMFVSVSLGSHLLTPKTLPLMRTLTTPVLGNFLMAFALSALMCFPAQTRLSLAGEFGTFGLIGIWRSGMLLRIMRRHNQNLRLERRHWLWHWALPSLGNISLLIAAVGLWRNWPPALNTVAITVLLLVVTGVVNAWEMALQISQSSLKDIEDMSNDS